MESFMEMLLNFLANYPSAAVLFSVMIVSRAIFKPACLVIQSYVDASPSKADDERWVKIKNEKWFKGLALAMDFLLSIKIPEKKK